MSSFIKDHPWSCAISITIGLLVLKYPDRAIFDEHREGIAAKKNWPLIGSLPKILNNRNNIHDFIMNSFTDLNANTITSSALGVPRSILTIDPQNVDYILKGNFQNYVKGPQLNNAMDDLFGHGIFNANGKEWQYQRKAASNIFNVASFRDHFTEIFVDQLRVMSEVLDQKENQIVDLHELMYKFTLDSFILIGFDIKLDSLKSHKKTPFASSFDICQQNCYKRFTNPIWKFSEALINALSPLESIQDHLKTVDQFAYSVIEQRRHQIKNEPTAVLKQRKDLLSIFMLTKNHQDQTLSDKELRDVVLNLIIAGRDTTAQALSWTFYNLLLHPRVERKLMEEIDEYITDDLFEDAQSLYNVVTKMVYVHAIFYEVLRLYPSVPNNQKYALEDDIWPDGTVIKKGDYILLCSWAQGRSERIWGPDAKQFRPERWITPGETGKLKRESPGQWPAFNGGPRTCLGQSLATLEALIAIIHLVKKYRFKLVPGQDVTYQVSLTLPMKNGLKVLVEKR